MSKEKLKPRIVSSREGLQAVVADVVAAIERRGGKAYGLRCDVGDAASRATMANEVIQRLGCPVSGQQPPFGTPYEQAGGCGGFGKGNFAELFKSIEEHESALGLNQQ